ncbi:alpha-glucuronidase family glycosyl hydrolase [Paenibacillus sp. LjRoot56]|uniref:alpha-glucuronidase family glycosyl hydrolase n=1 Tax=Paenibacillus sp. LjRoot56 TaxID=3342333 RepID=UPI003ED0DE4C
MSTHKQETDPCWLRYSLIDEASLIETYRTWCQEIVTYTISEVFQTAAHELHGGISALLGAAPVYSEKPTKSHAILLSVKDQTTALDHLLDTERVLSSMLLLACSFK